MTTNSHSYRSWSSPVPHCLEDIAGCTKDMLEAESCLKLLIATQVDSFDPTISNALSTSIVIHYCRCFTSGNRQKLAIENLAEANVEEKNMHRHIQDVRNRHVAHPVNLQEVYDLQLILEDDLASQKLVSGMSSLYVASQPLSRDDLPVALSLVDKWLRLLSNELGAEVLRLRPYADQLSQEQLSSLPIRTPVPNSNVLANRKQGHSK